MRRQRILPPWLAVLPLLLCSLFLAARVTAAEATSAPSTPSASDEVIVAIEFSGNRVTKERILLQEMVLKVGDRAIPELIESSRQGIMDLGLFTSVQAWTEKRAEGTVLRINVKEKYYILPVPKLNRNDDNQYSLGAELSLDNVAGLNQQVKLRYENEEANTLSSGRSVSYFLSYNYPRVYGTPFLFRTELSQNQLPAEKTSGAVVTSLYDKENWSVNMNLSRWLAQHGPSRGWQVGGGLVWRQNRYQYVSGATDPDFHEAQVVGASVQVQYLDVRDYLYSRQGENYGYTGEYSMTALGSDSRYTRHELFYRRYFLLEGVEHQNIDLQVRLDLSSGEMFRTDVNAYTLGGSKALRGYATGTFSGNAFVVANLQYLRPLFGYPMFRGVLFVDAGNAYPSNERIALGDLHWDAGVGLRLRLKSFVKIDLRVDAAYAHDTGEWRYFAGTNEMF